MKPLLYMVAGAVLAILGAAALLMAWAPAATAAGSYPNHYLSALENYQGVVVQDAHFEPFIDFVTHMSAPDWRERFNNVYAEQLHFSDTLAVVNDSATLGDYFARLHASGAESTVRVLNQQRSGSDGFLLWEMHSDFKPLGSTKHSHTIGFTHLRFDADGRVVLHQDFWDAAQGFYQHLPVMGSAIQSIRQRLQPDA